MTDPGSGMAQIKAEERRIAKRVKFNQLGRPQHSTECDECGGSGECDYLMSDNYSTRRGTCEDCDGKGYTMDECEHCGCEIEGGCECDERCGVCRHMMIEQIPAGLWTCENQDCASKGIV